MGRWAQSETQSDYSNEFGAVLVAVYVCVCFFSKKILGTEIVSNRVVLCLPCCSQGADTSALKRTDEAKLSSADAKVNRCVLAIELQSPKPQSAVAPPGWAPSVADFGDVLESDVGGTMTPMAQDYAEALVVFLSPSFLYEFLGELRLRIWQRRKKSTEPP